MEAVWSSWIRVAEIGTALPPFIGKAQPDQYADSEAQDGLCTSGHFRDDFFIGRHRRRA